MTIKHTPRYLIPIVLTILLSILISVASGRADAQQAEGDDYGIWYVQGTARLPGYFLQPNSAADGQINACRYGLQICEDRDGFLVYFGNSPEMAMDKSYVVTVTGDLEDPLITVSTFYDALYISEYAENLDVDLEDFARAVGLDSSSDNVQTIVIGQTFARNERGTSELTFRPVTGDIGAYLVTLTGYDIESTGNYAISLIQQ